MEKETTKCLKCGKENIKVMSQHERFCKGGPMAAEESVEQPKTTPLHVKNVMEYSGGYERLGENLVAWFEGESGKKIKKPADYMGSFSDGKNTIQTVLVLTHDGTLMPPFMIGGFIGMFPENTEFGDEPDEGWEKATTDQTPPEQEPETEPQPDTHPAPAPETPVTRRSLLDKLSGKNKPKEANEISDETMGLLKQIRGGTR